ncbi:tetratricopeptide repeat protein [Acidobacteria bacterium AB60]|nr:tetratricopeptide repeat protein [Acidobacteria bacterium AB60]
MATLADSRAAELLSQRGLDLLESGRPAEAAQAFRAAIASNDRYFEAHHGLVRALRAAGRLEQSIAAATALTTLSPNDPLSHTALSISLRRAGHLKEAEAATARARMLQWTQEIHAIPQETWIH